MLINRTTFGNAANRGSIISEEEAMQLLKDWVPNERLQLHMKQVGAVMQAWAKEKENLSDADAFRWWLAGVLHDADWEKHPDKHPQLIIEELENRNVDPEVIHAIAAHGPRHFGVEPVSQMDKMIYAIDELSGFIHAAALIRPTRYEGLDAKSINKKLKTPSFAAQVSREDVQDGVSRIGTTLDELIDFIIRHQKNVS